jgi:tripartite-type tricarboxylate transporter receptor subunit TctC
MMPTTMPLHRRLLLKAAACLAAALPTARGRAEAWPARPVRIVVGYPPGGVSDAITRALADKLTTRLGVAVLVENRAGAAGAVAMAAVAKSAPDGHTLCFSAISPLTQGERPPEGIAPLVSVMYTPVLVLGTPALAAGSFTAMLAAARAEPGSVRWATSGLGTTGHLVLEQVQQASGVTFTHVPYKGGGQQLSDALGGQFEVLSSNVGAAQLEHVHAGRFKPLAVGSPQRVAVLPEVPTLAELGFPKANRVSLFGFFAPAATPPARMARLNAEINAALASPEIREQLLAVNNVPTGGSAEEFARQIRAERAANRP